MLSGIASEISFLISVIIGKHIWLFLGGARILEIKTNERTLSCRILESKERHSNEKFFSLHVAFTQLNGHT